MIRSSIWSTRRSRTTRRPEQIAPAEDFSSAARTRRRRSGAVIEIASTVLANSQGGGNCEGEVLSDGDNLAADDSCGLGEIGDLESVDALLAPLGDHGGPTDTHLPLPGSPWIDGGDPVSCISATDQCGSLRPLDGDGDGTAACDIGAVEVLPEPTGAMLLPAGLLALHSLGRSRARRGFV